MYQKVLVPMDGSKLAECVVEHVKSIATGCQVPTVVLLRVVEPIALHGYLPREMAEGAYRDARETAEIQAKDYLNEMAERLKAEGIAVDTDITDGLPADEILSYADEKGVDLVVMSTHGKSGVSRWFSGSVAEKVVSQSLIPVLVVTPPGCRISK
ncbi:MAG: universal stress protein [Dehalococcoidales bacterium]